MTRWNFFAGSPVVFRASTPNNELEVVLFDCVLGALGRSSDAAVATSSINDLICCALPQDGTVSHVIMTTRQQLRQYFRPMGNSPNNVSDANVLFGVIWATWLPIPVQRPCNRSETDLTSPEITDPYAFILRQILLGLLASVEKTEPLIIIS
jgi:hypothetical protein